MLTANHRAIISLATGFSLFSATPEWPRHHEDTVPPLLTVAETIKNAGRAVPYLYSGGPSANLDHLWPGKEHVAGSARPLSGAPDFAQEYALAHTRLGDVCPGIKSVPLEGGTIAAWFLETVKDPEAAKAMPRSFLEASYHAIGWSPNGPLKTKALTILQQAIADSPEFVAYIEEKRKLLEQRIAEDAELQISDEQWRKMADPERERILDKVLRLTLSTLMPHNEIAFPRMIYARNAYPRGADYAQYSATYNEVYADGKNPLIQNNFGVAKKFTIHEGFHAFVSMLAQWYVDGKLQRNLDLHRQGKIYQLTALKSGAAISFKDSSEGYLTDPNERGARAFQLAAGGKSSFSEIQVDMFTFRYENGQTRVVPPPVFKARMSDGVLPPACQSG